MYIIKVKIRIRTHAYTLILQHSFQLERFPARFNCYDSCAFMHTASSGKLYRFVHSGMGIQPYKKRNE